MKQIMKAAILITLVFSITQPILAGTWRDDFSDPDTTQWEIYNTSDRLNAAEKVTTQWEIKDGVVYGTQREFSRQSTFLTGKLTWKNYSVSCRAKFVGERFPTLDLGLILHTRPKEHQRFMFLMHHDEQKISIVALLGGKWENGQFVITKEVKEINFDINLNTWYSLSAEVVRDNHLQFEIEDLNDPENKATHNIKIDKPITPGGLTGFIVSYADAVFDDLVIHGDNIPNGGTITFPVEPHRKLTTTWSRLKSK